MKQTISFFSVAIVAIIMSGMLAGCPTLKNITNALTGYQKLQFKLDKVDGFKLNGIAVNRFSQPNQIGAMDYARLVTALASKSLPVEFTLNVLAKNPNNGTAGTQSINLYLSRLEWTMLMDDRTTISGVVDQQLNIPGSGQSTNIPLTMKIDLYKFFGDKGLDDMVNLALAIGGAQGSSSRLKLTARVTVKEPNSGFSYAYPNEITIVDKQFTNP